MLSVNNISIHFTGTYIFKDVSFFANEKDRIGLVGKNGAGKTTLLNIIAGEMEPEKGDISSPKGSRIGYLQQQIRLASDETVKNEAIKAFDEAISFRKEAERITEELGQREDYESEDYLKLIDKLNHANERFEMLGGNTMEADTEKILLGLGFERADFVRPMKEFSGGWRMRIELAKILLRRPEILLLDEPTNHLDILSIQWLENFLKSYPGAVILVSHDRAFLDAVTNRTIEISLARITDYKASYSKYVQLREEQREKQKAAYDNQQKQIADIERFIERFRYKDTKAKQVQSRVKMLEKMDRVEVDEMDFSKIHFRFPPAPHSGKITYEANQLSKSYDEHLVLNELDFVIEKGESIAFVGRNGEGKSTLSKIIVNDLDFTGEGKLGHKVEIGYFAQNQAELLDQEKTVFATIDDVATGDLRTKVKNILGSFLFSGDDLEKKVKVLSGGEKSRLAIAQMLLKPVNLLVMDEPTNHLDMQSKDVLKSALLQFDGTLLIVSHDRDFLQGLTNKVFEFKNKKIRQHIGDVYDFLKTRELEDLKDLELLKKSGQGNKDKSNSEAKLSYEKQKELDRERKRLKKKIQQSEERIEQYELEIENMDEILASPEKYPERFEDGKIYQEYEGLKKKLEDEMELWEELQMESEE
jgi:ATP-binding cassette subfamily F protein 3